MTAWALNPFLTSYRLAVNTKYPTRTKASDGTIGDRAHKLTTSQHNEDIDGSVDAWDMDVNLYGSDNETGTPAEDAAVRKVLDEFERQPQAQLWIYNGQIANRDDGWKRRKYTGKNPHNKHAHLQSRSTREREKYTGDMVVDAINVKVTKPGRTESVPVKAGFELRRGSISKAVKALQDGMNRVFPAYDATPLDEDGIYGPGTERAVKEFQRRTGLKPDGIVGVATRALLARYGVRI